MDDLWDCASTPAECCSPPAWTSSGPPSPASRSGGAAGVGVDERRVVELCGPAATLSALRFADGAEQACQGLLVPATLKQRSPLAAQIGAELAGPGPVAFDAVRADPMNRTSVPEVFAAGDTAVMPSVTNAVASGSVAAAMIVHDLVSEAHGLPGAA